jgi:agmatinase
MAGLHAFIEDLLPGTVAAVVGVPFDRNASFRRGSGLAPARIREALFSESANLCTEGGLDLGAEPRWMDAGDLDLSDPPSAFDEIERAVTHLLKHDVRVFSLGGDHSITYPIVRAHAGAYVSLNILQLDAHPDLYDELDGNRFSHAAPFARIMEDRLAARLVQVGVRTMTPHQQDQADKFGVEVVDMRDWHLDLLPAFDGPVYVSIDLDCLDPAFAPAVSHPEPGGFSTRDVIAILQRLKGRIVGIDLVEYNPDRDLMGLTGMTAAKLLKEGLARLLG